MCQSPRLAELESRTLHRRRLVPTNYCPAGAGDSLGMAPQSGDGKVLVYLMVNRLIRALTHRAEKGWMMAQLAECMYVSLLARNGGEYRRLGLSSILGMATSIAGHPNCEVAAVQPWLLWLSRQWARKSSMAAGCSGWSRSQMLAGVLWLFGEPPAHWDFRIIWILSISENRQTILNHLP